MQADQPDRYMQCEELEVDGLFGTPDLIEPDAETLHEFKATWMSAKNGPGSQKFWKYETQAGAYTHMLGWRRALLHVAFVNGGYEWVRGGEPKWRTWEYVFAPHELRANWGMLLKQAN
jgi:hypothetical protein